MRHPGYRANNGQPLGLRLNVLYAALMQKDEDLEALRAENARLRSLLDSILLAAASAEAQQTTSRQ